MNRGLRKELAVLSGLTSLGFLLGRKNSWGVALGLCAAALHFYPSSYSFRNRTVIITGGSRGLGLALAENFLKAGARVALLARDTDELDRACTLLQERAGSDVFAIGCDITQPVELRRAFEQIEGIFGRIDILVNNAGAIAIGPFETMERADFEVLLELQVHAVVHSTQLVLPFFRQQGEGRIVNICSVGGKVAVPHMSTYCAAKFALAGLSSTLTAELAQENVLVTTVFPGLMRTGSPMQATIKGDHEKEFAWFALGDVTPIASVSAQQAARRILSGIRDGETEVVFPTTAKLAVLAQTHFPELFALARGTAARFFPKGTSTVRKTGAESRSWLEQQPFYAPFRQIMEKAEAQYNQQEKSTPDFNLGTDSV